MDLSERHVFGPVPEVSPQLAREPIIMSIDEYEAFRLIYYDGLKQQEATERVDVSRGTVWRCLENARRKVAAMLVERRPLIATSTA